MFCKYCGKEINSGVAFCKYCGRQLLKTAPNTESTGDVDAGSSIKVPINDPKLSETGSAISSATQKGLKTTGEALQKGKEGIGIAAEKGKEAAGDLIEKAAPVIKDATAKASEGIKETGTKLKAFFSGISSESKKKIIICLFSLVIIIALIILAGKCAPIIKESIEQKKAESVKEEQADALGASAEKNETEIPESAGANENNGANEASVDLNVTTDVEPETNGAVRHWDEKLSMDDYNTLVSTWINTSGVGFQEISGSSRDIDKPFSAICVDGRLCVICDANEDDRWNNKYALLFTQNGISDYLIDSYRYAKPLLSFDTGEIISLYNNGVLDNHYEMLNVYGDSLVEINLYGDANGEYEFVYWPERTHDYSNKKTISDLSAERIMKYHMGDAFQSGIVMLTDQGGTFVDMSFSSPERGKPLGELLTWYDNLEDAINNAYELNTMLTEDYYEVNAVDVEYVEFKYSYVFGTNSTEYILPDSDKKYYSVSELSYLTDEQLRLARNELFARHGRKFNDTELQQYFTLNSWYHPVYEPDEFDKIQNSVLNEYEIANRDLIVGEEKRRKN